MCSRGGSKVVRTSFPTQFRQHYVVISHNDRGVQWAQLAMTVFLIPRYVCDTKTLSAAHVLPHRMDPSTLHSTATGIR
jgi:hypothetical protein